MGLMIGSVSASDLILDGHSVSLYEGGNPPVKLWPTIRETVQITLGTGFQARDQFRAALTDRGMNYGTVTEIPFDIELVGSGSVQNMFDGCYSLTSAPAMDTSSVTRMDYMFYGCASLTHVPDMDTSQVTNASYMFYGCEALTDGNVRLIGKHPDVNTTDMITDSGLTREPFYEVVQITLNTGLQARNQLRAALSARGLDYQTVTEIPFIIEMVGTGATQQMFDGCAALTSVPAMNTSGVDVMAYMFRGCAALTSVPDLDTAQVSNMREMFYGCASLTHVPDMDTSQVTIMANMFRNCAALTDGSVRLIGRNQYVNTTDMITGSGLTRLPFYDTAGNPI